MRRTAHLLPLLLLVAALAGCVSTRNTPRGPGDVQEGTASWYGGKFNGRPTASGERYDMHGYTAAHRELPFGTWLRVENLSNGKTVAVKVNDRGPFKSHRILDLSFAAATDIDLVRPGTARVRITVMPNPPLPREGYTVQVGAFSEEDRAEVLRETLLPEYPQTAVRNDGVWHRVQVGDGLDRDAAEMLRGELMARGFQALVVLAPGG